MGGIALQLKIASLNTSVSMEIQLLRMLLYYSTQNCENVHLTNKYPPLIFGYFNVFNNYFKTYFTA